ncbi:MAG: hypothetical protein SFW09_15355 [Hyphomicrobiaceae bacterium]|nr:hypothetical protein [Hyphomicrobiaceae bacterium]
MSVYEHHVVAFGPGRLAEVTRAITSTGRAAVAAKGGQLFGVWKPLIGISFNHVVAVTEWPDEAVAADHADTAIMGISGIKIEQHDVWLPTLRPAPGSVCRSDPGFVTHRWYDIREADIDRFLELSSNTWGNWEGVHDGGVQGLWRQKSSPAPGLIRMRLMAWYRDMSVWERSRHWKGTKGAETANKNLGQRYDLTLDSAVSILQPVV